MQISHLNKYESLVDKHLQTTTYDQPLTFDQPPLQPFQLKEILDEIDSINLARSYPAQLLSHEFTNQNHHNIKSNQSSAETEECDFAQTRTYKSDRTKHSSKTNRSLIFASPKFSKIKQHIKSQEVRIFYFNLPLNKTLKYDNATKISDLIAQAISAYLQDSKLDQQRVKLHSYQSFQLRLLKNQEAYKADYSIPSISYERLVSQNIFDSLVLVYRQQQTDKFEKSEVLEKKKVRNQITQNIRTIFLYNQLGDQLGCLNMTAHDSLQSIFQHIKLNELNNMQDYFLTQNKNDSDGLPRDFQVKDLQSNKIYIKTKKYIDDSQWETNKKPIKHLAIFNKETEQPSINMPIGLSQASQYEEFSVIKVNSMGFQQERIMGIDQTKLYNYDKSFREEKKQTSFLSKIFGVNSETGTKKPYRLIKDILELKKTQKGLEVVFKEKTIPFIAKSREVREKIYRKLSFLVNLTKQQQSNNNIKHSKC